MNQKEQQKFDVLYQKHCSCLQLQGKAKSTIENYSRGLRRFTAFLDRSPDSATKDDFQRYFKELLKTRSWSTIKCDRVGLQFFYIYVLEKKWDWVKIVKPPTVKSIPNVLTESEVKLLLSKIKKMRYRIFFSFIFHGLAYKRGFADRSWRYLC